MTETMRLQKFLSHAGIASRRASEKMIADGRVAVNGKAVRDMGTKVDPFSDVVKVDDQIVQPPDKSFYLMMNKPPKTVCTEKDPQGRKKVGDLLPKHIPRIFTIGRLDYHTEGLLLFTNDGELSQALMKPSSAVAKIYHVKIQGPPDPEIVARFERGVRLEDGTRTKPSPTELLRTTKTNCWYEIILTEGKNRQIHRMFQTMRRTVLKLKRMNYGPLNLGLLDVGEHRFLSDNEVRSLYREAGLRLPKKPRRSK